MLADLSGAARVWGVVAVRPRKEGVVLEGLLREGLTAYYPRLRGPRAGARVAPLFPGYLFAHLSPRLELSALRRQPGVIRPLVFQGQLACIEPELIERWQARESGRGYLLPEAPPPFRRGERVRFSAGVFSGLEATVLEVLPSRERVRLLLQHLGGEAEVEADRRLLRAAPERAARRSPRGGGEGE